VANETIYRIARESLVDLLKAAGAESGEATLLIPDLQRPFVWKPLQVALLVDSLLRGWPFGTLLLWEVEEDGLDEQGQGTTVPTRAFWKNQVEIEYRPDDFRWIEYQKARSRVLTLVLDGQQRLQSLLLAFGGDRNGYTLYDRTWADVLDRARPRARDWRKYWSRAQLCLDLTCFLKQRTEGKTIRDVDYARALEWVICEGRDGVSTDRYPDGYGHPLHRLDREGHRDRFIPLRRLWQWADPGRDLEEYPSILERELSGEGINANCVESLLKYLPRLLELMGRLKDTDVGVLKLLPFPGGEPADRDRYDFTIVSIFTRLNKAGTVLTEQQITFAWIKRGWIEQLTGGRSAIACFDDLEDEMKLKYRIDPGTDEVVRIVSAIWAVMKNDGTLLAPRDLLRGDIVRPLAREVNRRWDTLSESVLQCCEALQDHGLEYRRHYLSINVLAVLAAWHEAAMDWLSDHRTDVMQKHGFEQSIAGALGDLADRWALLTSWAGRWGDRSTFYTEAMKMVSRRTAELHGEPDPIRAAAGFRAIIEELVAGCQTDAVKYVQELAVPDRNSVYLYHVPLWVWHRLRVERRQAARITLREKKGRARTAITHVDHAVSHAYWEKALKAAAVQSPVDSADGGQSVINDIGNMLLLEQSFNINKSEEPLVKWTPKVQEFQDASRLAEWRQELLVDDVLFNPEVADWPVIRDRILSRGRSIREVLIQYIQGELTLLVG
jgi:hypothetical protein